MWVYNKWLGELELVISPLYSYAISVDALLQKDIKHWIRHFSVKPWFKDQENFIRWYWRLKNE